MHNAAFWKARFQNDFVPAVQRVKDTFLQRVIPSFSTVDSECDKLEQRLWDEAMAQPYYGDGPDGADIAEAVRDAAVSHYLGLKGMEQGLLNCCAIFLYHVFEQHLMLFHRKELLGWKEQDDSKLFTHNEIRLRLASAGIEVTQFKAWPKLEELRVLAGTIKHGEGKSSKHLHTLAPELFRAPTLAGTGFGQLATSGRVYTPLIGEDIFVTQHNINEYSTCIEQFWSELGVSLEGI